MSFHRLLARLLVVTTTLVGPLFPFRIANASSNVVIGEVMWAGSSLSTSDEWIELWNLGNEPVSLAGWSLEGGSSSPIVFPEGAVIPPTSTYIISNYSASDTKSVLMHAPDLVTTAVLLSNSSLKIILRAADGTELDHAGEGNTPPAGTSGTIKASMVRSDTVWISATSSLNLKPESADLATPGFCDGCTQIVEPVPEPEIPTEPESLPEPEPVEPPVEEIPPTEPAETAPIPEEPTATTTEPTPPEEQPEHTTEETSPAPETSAPTLPTPEEQSETVPEAPAPQPTPEEPLPVTASEAPAPTPTQEEPVEPTSTTELPPRYDLLRLNEIMPAPASGPEWIELTSLDTDIAIPLTGLQLHDAAGKIYTFASGTIDATTPFVRATLSSSKLNNSGDAVSLVDPAAGVLETFTYEGSETGSSWSRSPDGTGSWVLVAAPTPEESNGIPEANEPEAPAPPMPPVTPTPSSTSMATTTQAATGTIQYRFVPPGRLIQLPILASSEAVKSTAKKTTAPKTTATKTTSTKTSTKKTSTKAAPIPLTHDMVHLESNAGIPVILNGRVGTQPGLLSGHHFVLLAPDGRGIRVRLPTSRKLPDAGAYVRVVGVITFDEKGIPTVGVRKDDPVDIQTETDIPMPQPRIVNFLSPSAEDSWSLIHVTGTVLSVKGTTVMLDLNDVEIAVLIKSQTGYRTSRLTVGDTITVRGVLENTGDEYRILPRNTDDIAITANAHAKPMEAKAKTFPGWTPFGAAAAAIAGTEGAKKLRDRHKQRKLEKILETEVDT